MRKDILNFCTQFEFEPQIQNGQNLGAFSKFLVAGMGGSHLAADLIKLARPGLDLVVHKSYDLPALADLSERLIIANSYSGNTEETLTVFDKAIEQGLSVAVATTGGKLLERAQKQGTPLVLMPDIGLQPRLALGFNVRALLKIVGDETGLKETFELGHSFHPEKLEEPGRSLAKKLRGHIPIIYASSKNWALAYNWKIRLNETGKVPAFWNQFPELNHNEMQGFGGSAKTAKLKALFQFIFLYDETDHPRILKRMKLTKQLLEKQDLPVKTIDLEGSSGWHKIFNNLALADWVSFYLADLYGNEPEPVPLIEEFKQLLR